MFRLTLFLTLLVVLGGFGSSAEAQGVVPGGWAPQFGYQSFSGPGYSGAAMSFGTPGYTGTYGMSGFGGMNPYGSGVNPGFFPGVPSAFPRNNRAFVSPPPAQTVTAMDPLIHSIRQSTKRRKVR